MNYNTTPQSQNIPRSVQTFLPQQYQWISSNNFAGDWLAVIGRKNDDSVLSKKFVSNFKQGAFKALPIPLPFSGRPKDVDPTQRRALSDFLRSDHARFWDSNNSWPAVFLTDTADFRGYMKTCYHQQCDNMDRVKPEMITFMGRTADALVAAAQSLTEQVCPSRENCKNVTIKGDNSTISSPSYPSEYPNGIECSWLKEISSSSGSQLLQFEDFNLEESASCANDFLEVSAGNTIDNMRVIDKYCGSTKPSTIRVPHKIVKVGFVTDALVSKKGFRITWTTPPQKPNSSSTAGKGVLCLSALLAVLIHVLI
ncbi:dorsal-ventral patterning tolloid-like protein 1 [Actinia tenebrosa]|uniref:Dorsal-ventral patterning tolloid-like protein 1 n=1 Tax=Actinia tenebrosa TaxID=6105 RepID=A0A6P8GZW4_ACTTE|nr:dorsal-ventral patterning tolloid-like protein 1 [Actinia tenebrosa]